MRVSYDIPKRLARLTITFMMAWAWCGMSNWARCGDAPYSLHKSPSADLPLTAPRTFAMTHVDAGAFAAALGKDPERIFEFVRDRIGYESYAGCLRGPRGTLLAMAGNSVDRAALLAGLLQAAGQRVRFVRGTLPEKDATALVMSMWVQRPGALPSPRSGTPDSALTAAVSTLADATKRDYAMIVDQLKRANVAPAGDAAPSVASLLTEAKLHYWVQWQKEGSWVDLDPSFTDAVAGRTYAPVEETFDALPERLFHRATFRVRIEEYPVMISGGPDGRPSNRDVLVYTAHAMELSGVDLVFSHRPENWKGPVKSVADAVAAAAADSSRVKPVLLSGRATWVAGDPFQTRLPAGGGLGGIGAMLGGEGTRKAVPIATREWLEFEFVAPDGHQETVVRDLFDLEGPAARAEGKLLSADEVRQLTQAKSPADAPAAIYSLFVTTGRVDARHLRGAVEEQQRPDPHERLDVRAALRRMNVTFVATSDALLARLGDPRRAEVLFYPDSPRVQILELSPAGTKWRLSLDLRRDRARAVVTGPHPEDAFSATVFRGVVEGTLERTFLEYVIACVNGKQQPWGPAISTSLLFDHAQAQGVAAVCISADSLGSTTGVAPDALARLTADVSRHCLAVAPQHPLVIAGTPRFAWWRIDPHSGETIAVTDEGLFQAVAEREVWTQEGPEETTVIVIEYGEVGAPPGSMVGNEGRTFLTGSRELSAYIDELMHSGINTIFHGLPWPY